ncbi:MAG: hypothetical protein RI902_1322, partial [Pseudomonadota bacterium]
LAPPAHETRQRNARNAVGQQKVDVFLQQPGLKYFLNVHRLVT